MELVSELVDILEKTNGYYEQLVEITRREKGLLEKGDVESLKKVVEEKEAVSFSIRLLDEKRRKQIGEIAGELDPNNNQLTLKNIAQEMENAELGDKLMKAREKLFKSVEILSEYNSFNARLLASGIATMKKTLQATGGQNRNPETYTSAKQMEQSNASGNIIKKSL